MAQTRDQEIHELATRIARSEGGLDMLRDIADATDDDDVLAFRRMAAMPRESLTRPLDPDEVARVRDLGGWVRIPALGTLEDAKKTLEKNLAREGACQWASLWRIVYPRAEDDS